MKPVKLLAALLFFILFTSKGFGQTVDSARYVTPSQDIISVYFSGAVVLPNLTGWTLNLNGTVHNPGAAAPGFTILSVSGNRVNLKLTFTFPKTNIDYNDVVAGVKVIYNGAGSLTVGGVPMGAFNITAINNIIIDCSMLSSVQDIGTAASTGPCQSVTIQLSISWTWTPQARNSTHFTGTQMIARVFWRNLTDTRLSYTMTESVLGSGKFSIVTSPAFTYQVENKCTFGPTAFPMLFKNPADLRQPTISCAGGVNQQNYVIPAYRLDNEPLGGLFRIIAPVGDPTTLFCVGENINGFIFYDATTFNCNISVEADRPNQGQRWMRFIYGTHATAGIPNVTINVFGNIIPVTDNNGNVILGPFNRDPLGNLVAPYMTTRGFEGQLFTIPDPCSAPIAQTYPISHTGDYNNDFANDIFGVTLQNWGPCNKYTDLATPIETAYSELRLVASPPLPTASDKTVCYSAVPGTNTLTAVRNGAAPGLLHWYNNADLLLIHEVGTTGSYDPGTLAAGVYHYWVREIGTTGLNCEGPAKEVILTIKETLTAPGAITGPANSCPSVNGLVFNLPIDPPTMPAGGATQYVWSVPAGLTIFSGQGTKTLTVDVGATSGVKTISVYLQYTSAPNCPTSSVTKDLTVYSIVHNGGAIAGTGICPSGTVNITNTTGASTGAPASAGPTYSWDRAPGPAFSVWTPLVGAGATFSETMATSGTYRYRRTATFGCGTPVTATVDVPVYSTVHNAGVIASSDICAGLTVNITNTTAASTGTPASSGPVYTWHRAPGPAFSVWTALVGSATTYSEVMATAGTYRYRRTATFGCGTAVTATVDVNVFSTTHNAGVIAVTDICPGGTANVTSSTPATTGTPASTGPTYSWYRAPGPAFSVWTNLIGNSDTFSEVLASTGTFRYRRRAVFGCGSSVSAYIDINVFSTTHNAGTISIANVCAGGTVSVSSTAAATTGTPASSGPTYSWERAPGPAYAVWTGLVGTGATYSETIATAGTYRYRRTAAFGCGTPISTTADVSVYSTTHNAGAIAGTTICANGTVNITNTTPASTGTPASSGPTYSWDRSPGPAFSVWTPLVGAAATFSETMATAGTYRYRRTAAFGCGTAVSTTVDVVVNPNPTPVISGLTSVCAGDVLIGYSTPNVLGNSYVWNISGGIITGGAGTNAITVTWGAAGPGWVRVTETMAVTLCQVTTANYDVTKNLGVPGVPSVTAGTPEICRNGSQFINITEPLGATSYNWDYSWVGGAVNATTAVSEITIDLTGVAVGNHTVTAQAGNGCGWSAWMPVYSFDINDKPDLTAASANPCSDVATGITLSITNAGAYCSGLLYNITNINNGGLTASAGLPAIGNGFAANVIADDAWTNKTALNVNVVYTVVPVSIEGCSGPPETVTVTVKPEADLSPLSATVCSDASTGILLTIANAGATIGAVTYTVNSINNGGLTDKDGTNLVGASGGTALIQNDQWTNKTGGNVNVVYNITPVGANGCTSDAENVTVTVTPEPDLSPLSATVCSDAITNITLTDVFGLASRFEIVSITPTGGMTAGGGNSTVGTLRLANAIQNDTWTNKTATFQTVTYVITPRINPGCIGDPENVIVTVNPEPDLSPLSATVCSDVITNIVLTDVFGLADRYEIVSITPTGGITAGGSNATVGTLRMANAIQNDTWTNKTAINQTVTYVIKPRINLGCIGDAENVIVTIKPEADLSPLSATVCSDASTGILLTIANAGATIGAVTYTVNSINNGGLTDKDGTNLVGASGGTALIQTDQWTNKTGGNVNVVYNITPVGANGCTSDAENVTVTVTPEPDLSPLSATVCSDAITNITLTDVFGLASRFEIVSITPTGGMTAGGSNSTVGTLRLANAIQNDTWTNKTATFQTVTYVITPRIDLGCIGDPENVIVTVNPEPDLSPLSATVCSDAITNITFTDVWGLADRFEIVSITPTGGITAGGSNATVGTLRMANAIQNDTWTNKTAINQTVTYVIKPRINLGCIGDAENVIATIKPEADLSPLSATVCSDASTGILLTIANAGAAVGAVTYTVNSINNGGLTDKDGTNLVGASGGTALIQNDQWTNKTGGNVNVVYNITPVGANGCTSDAENVTVTVTPEPDLNNTNKTVCSNIGTGITLADVHGLANRFEIVSIVVDAGLTPGGSNSAPGPLQMSTAIFNDEWTNITSGALTVTYIIIPRINLGCIGDPETLVVTVSPEPDLSPLNKTICNGTATGVTLSDVLGLADQFDISSITPLAGLVAGGGNVAAGTGKPANYISADTWTNTTTGNLTVTYVVVPSIGGTCYGQPESVVITVRPPVIPGSITGSTSICYNADAPNIPNAVLASGGDGSMNYSWYYTVVLGAIQGDGNWTLIAGATDPFYNPGVLTDTTKFVRKAMDSSCTEEVYSNMITITINPLPVTPAITGDAVICETATNKVYQVVNRPGSTYAWTVPDSISIEAPAPPSNLYFIIVDALGPSLPGDKITITETLTSTTNCTGLPVEFPISIVDKLPGQVVSGPLTVCKGDTGVIYSVANNAGSTYSWSVPAGAFITTPSYKNQISVTFNMAVNGQVSVIETSGTVCTTVHVPINITVNPLPTQFNLTSPVAYCAGATGVTITLSGSQAGVNYQLFNSGGPVAGGLIAGTGAAIEWFNNLTETYHVVATNTATGCVQQMNGTVVPTINFVDGGAIGSAQAVCENSSPMAFTNTTAATGGGSLTYQWESSPDDATWTSIPGATSALYAAGSIATDTWFRRMAFSTMGTSVCPDPSNSVLVTSIIFSPGTLGPDQTVCENGDPAAIGTTAPTGSGAYGYGYQWKISTDGVNFSNIIGATTDSYDPGALITDTWYKREVTATFMTKACTEETNAVRITVNNFSPGSIGSAQTICEATSPAALTSVAPGGDGSFTYSWESSPDGNAPWTVLGVATATYAPGPLSANTYYRREVRSLLNTVTCSEYTNTVLITVNSFNPGTIGSPQVICENTAPAAFSSTLSPSGAGAFTYQWQNSPDDVSYSSIGGATAASYTSGNLTVDTYFRRQVTSTLNGKACIELTPSILVQVNNVTPGTIGTAQTICEGATPAPLTETGAPAPDGAISYQWQESPDGSAFVNVAAAGNAATYSPGALSADTWYRRQLTSTIGANLCTKESNIIKITVNNFIPGNIAADQTICENSAPAAFTSTAPSGDGAFTYKWFFSTDDATYFQVGGAFSQTYSAGPLAVDTWYFREVTSILPGNSCIERTDTLRITVNNFLPGAITGDQEICEGDTPAGFGSTAASGDGAITYSWEQSTDGIVFTAIGGSNIEIYVPGALTADTWYKRKATSLLNGNNCTEETSVIKVTVINFTAGSIGSDQTICEGATPSALTSVASTGDGSFVYSWESSPDGSAPWTVLGVSTPAYGPGALTANTYYRRQVTASIGSTSCSKYSNTVLITVNSFDPGTIGSPQVICENTAPGAFSSTLSPSGAGSFTYQWQNSTDGTNFSSISGATNETYTSGNLSVDTWFRRQVTSTLNGKACIEQTPSILVQVNNLTPGSVGTAQTICEGSTPAPLTETGAPTLDGAITYQWQESADGSAFVNVAAAGNAATYAPGALSADTWYRRQVTSTIGANLCTEESNIIKVTVNNFIPGNIAADQTICENSAPAAFTSTTPSGDGAFTYKWFYSTDDATYFQVGAALSETYSPGALTQDTWYFREVTSTLSGNTCIERTDTLRITVNNFLPGAITGNQEVCEGSAPAIVFGSTAPSGDGTFTYEWKQSTDGIIYTSIAASNVEVYSPGPLTADIWYKRAVTSTLNGNTCTEETNAIKVTVINFTPGSIASDQTVCEGSAPAPFTSVAASGDGTKGYQWEFSIDGTVFNTIGGAISATYASTPLSVDTWFRRLSSATVGSLTCTEITDTVFVKVIIFDPGTISSDQTVCEGSAPLPFTSGTPTGNGVFTYLWQSSLDGVGYSNITGATNETYASGALSADTYFRRQVTSTLNGKSCQEVTAPILVTVNNLTPGTISGTQTICEGDIPAAFTNTMPVADGGLTYQWQDSPDGTAFTDIAGAIAAAYTPGAITADTWYRRRATSTIVTNICTEESNIIKVTVNNFIPGNITSDQVICENTAAALLTSVTPTGDGTFSYKWFFSTDDITYNQVGGALSETYSPGLLTQDRWYFREVTSTLSGKLCVERADTLEIIVNNLTPGSITASETICEGGDPVAFASVLPTYDGALTYEWQMSTDGINFTPIAGTNTETYDSPALTADTWFRRAVSSTIGGSTCTEETNQVKITVVNFTPGAIGSDQTICSGTAPAAFTSVAASGDGVKSYVWESSIDGITFNIIGGATAATYASPSLIADTWFRRLSTANVGGFLCTEITDTVLVTVINFVPGSITADQTICEGDVPAAFVSVPSTGDGIISYQWQGSLDGGSYTSITGATSELYVPGALTADTWYRRQATAVLNGTPCVLTTAPVIITVNNVDPGSIGGTQTICEGGTPAAFTSAAATGDGTITYQWQDSPDGTTFTDIGGATAATFAPGALTADTWYQRIATSDLLGFDCIEASNIIKVTVNNFIPGNIAADQTICENTAPAPLTSTTPSGDGIFTYRWFRSTDGSTFGVIGTAVSETYSPGLLTQDTWYFREVKSTLGTNSCIAGTDTILITVNNFLPGSITGTQTICEGVDPAVFGSVLPTGDGVYTYQWQESPDGIAFTDLTGETSATYDPPALSADTWYKRLVTSSLNGTDCTEETNMIRVSVINFAPGSIDADQTICEGATPSPFTSVAASGDGTKGYQWESSINGVAFNTIGGATSATYTSGALTQDTWFRRLATATMNTVSCTEISDTIIITVNNFDPGTISIAQTICEGDTPAPFTSGAPSGDGAFTFQWQSSTDGVSFSSISGASTDVYSSGPLTVDTWFRRQVTSTLNGMTCSEFTPVIKVTVNNLLPGSIGTAQIICEGGTPAALTSVPASGDGTITYQWQDSPDGTTFTDIGGATAATIAPGALTADTWYRRTAISDLLGYNCTAESNIVKITVNNFDPGNIAAVQTICENTAPVPFTSTSPSGDGSFTYRWFRSIDGSAFNLIATAVSETFSPGVLAQDTWYFREVKSTLGTNSCIENTDTLLITVNNFVPGTIAAEQTICEGGDPAAFTSGVPTGDGTFTYQWYESADGTVYTSIGGATFETYDPSALTVDTWFKRAVTSTFNGNMCTEETAPVRVYVINFTPGTIGSDQTICEGTIPATFTGTPPAGDGAFSYSWEFSTDSIAWNPVGGASASAYTSTSLSVDTWFRRLTTSTLNGFSCSEMTVPVKVTVNNFDPQSIAGDQWICENDTPLPFTSTTPTGDGIFTYQWQSSINGTIFSNITGATLETYAPSALSADTWYRRQVTSTLNGNTCTEPTAAVKVTVNNLTPGSIGAAQAICEGDIPAPFTSVAPTYDGIVSYEWQSSADGTTFAPIPGATNETYSSIALTADTWFKRLVTSTLPGVACTGETNIIKVTVNNFVPGNIGSAQTICEGGVATALTSVTPTGDGIFTYRWFSSINGTAFLVIPGAINETYSPGTLTADMWYTREVTSTLLGKPCVEMTDTIRITVNNFTPGALTGDQTICSGTAPVPFGYTAPAGDGGFTYQWRISTDGANYNDIGGAIGATYTPGALTQDTWYIRRVTSTLNTVTCVEETNFVKVTVNNVNGGTIISDQTICNSSDPVPFISVVHGNGDGAITWQWQDSPDGVTFTDIPGANGLNYDSPVIAANTYFRRVTKSMLDFVECTSNSNIVLITVNAVAGGTISADQAICYGEIPVAFISDDDGSGTGAVTYQWLRSNNNVIWNTISGATGFTYAPGILYTDTYYKRVLISILNGVLCQAESNVVMVTVNTLPTAILTGGETICPGDPSILKVTIFNGLGPFEVELSDGTIVTNYDSDEDIIVTPAATTLYTVVRVLDLNGCEATTMTGSATVTVRALPAITVNPVDRTICEFAMTTFEVTATGTDLTYQWFVDPATGTFAPVVEGGVYFGSDQKKLSLFGTTRDMTSYRYYAEVTGCATTVESDTVLLTVETVPEIISQPSDTTICSTQGASFYVNATGTTLTYIWQVKTGALPWTTVTDAGIYTGATTDSLVLAGVPGTMNNSIFRVIVDGTCGVPVYSNFVVLRVNVPPTVTVQPLPKSICDGTGTRYFLANGTGMIDSLRWQVSIDGGVIFTDIYDGVIYSGTTSQQLAVTDAPLTYNGNLYRLALKAICATTYSNSALLTVNSLPVITFVSDPIPACGGVAQTLTPNITGGSGTWNQHTWTGDVGPLNNYSWQNPVFKTMIPGPYALNYRVRDSNGCYGNKDVVVMVDSPDATFTQDATSGCTPATVNFTKDMTGISSWTWDFGDGTPVNTTDANPVHIFTNTTATSILYRTVRLTVVSPGGCTAFSTSMMTVYPAVNAAFTTSDDTVCSGSMLTFTAAPGAADYAWDYGDGAAGSGGSAVIHTYTNLTGVPVTLDVTLTTTSAYSCIDTRMLSIVVMPDPVVLFTATPSSQIFNAAGNTVAFLDQTSPASALWTYAWDFGDTGTSTARNPSHTYFGVGDYDVTLTVSNGKCTSQLTSTITILPEAPVANFNFVPSTCAPLYVELVNTSLHTDIPGTTYRWNFGDGNFSTLKNPTYTYFTPGAYTLELIVTGPGGQDNYSQKVDAYQQPTAYFQITPSLVFVNDEMVRCFNLTQNGDSYMWEFGDGETSTEKEPFHKYMEEGVYDVTLWAYKHYSDTLVCTDKYVLSPAVTVEPAGEIRFSTVFTPNLTGPIDLEHLPTGGDEIDQFFFPPIREKVTNYKLQVFNRLGMLIFESRDINHPWNGYYKGQLCPQGVYVWYVEGKYANGKPFKKVGDVTLLH